MRPIHVFVFVIVSLVALGVTAQDYWYPVVGQGAATPGGFGDGGNDICSSSAVLGGYLYMGTANSLSAVSGAEVWRSSDGAAWTRVNADGFGGTLPENNVVAYSMEVFGSDVFAATSMADAPMVPYAPAKVWRYNSGTSWTQVNTDGFGDGNIEPWAMEVFPGTTPTLCVGSGNYSDGAELWCSADGASWGQVNTDGFGNTANGAITALTYFNGDLYAATRNDTTGVELWRSSNLGSSSNWDEVNSAGGFGGSAHYAAYAMAVFDGYLYLSTFSETEGGSVYRSTSGALWTEITASQDGFGDANNWGGLAMAVHDGALYLGTYNWTTGAEMWKTTDGTNWNQVNDDGFGRSGNLGIYTFSVFDGELYAGLFNGAGCEVWRSALFADGFESGTPSAWVVP